MKIVLCKNPETQFRQNLIFLTIEAEEISLDFNTYFEIDQTGHISLRNNYQAFFKDLTSMDIFYAQVNTNNLITRLITLDYRLPTDSAELLRNNGNHRGDNYSLYLNKAGRFNKDKFHLVKNGRFIKEFNFGSLAETLENLHRRKVNYLKALYGVRFKSIKLCTSWRLTIGLGGESIYETDMSLHPVYGFPYIPSSAVKGVVRSWIIREIFESNEDMALNESKLFCDIFGCGKNSYYRKSIKGKALFYDAYPSNSIHVKPDVMNPHYQDYYNARKMVPPADYLKPIPVFFLTVTETNFIFFVAYSEPSGSLQDYQEDNKSSDGVDKLYKFALDNGYSKDSSVLDFLIGMLQYALTNHGIGAKTAVGYGRLETA
jgi:CRISPR-associated protein Cmr6